MQQTPWKPRRRQLLATGASAFALMSASTARAQGTATFPGQNVTLIVPYAPGGGTDILSRLIATELQKQWKVTVVVENKPGAGGQIGNAMVARAKPDGHTLLVGITPMIQETSLYKNLPYNVFRDFTPLVQLASSTNYLVVPGSTPVNNLKEYIAYAKTRAGRGNYGSNGNAGSSHLCGSLFNSTQNLGMVHVPFSGSGPLLTALLGGQVDMAFVDIAPLRSHIGTGKLKFLACTTTKRLPVLPDVPTLAESGLPGFEPMGWFALFGPAGMAPAVKKTIADAVVAALQTPEIAKRIDELGLSASGVSLDAFAKVMKDDREMWAKMIESGNIKVE